MKTENNWCWCPGIVLLGLATGGCASSDSKTAAPEMERLVVCEVSGDPHLQKDDVIYLRRRGSSGRVDMEIVRYEGMPNEMHPWKSAGGANNAIPVDPSITGKDHNNAAFRKFSPEGVGTARINPHAMNEPAEDHPFSMRRNTRANFPNPCNTPPGEEDLIIFVPPHVLGGRHGGHAIAD